MGGKMDESVSCSWSEPLPSVSFHKDVDTARTHAETVAASRSRSGSTAAVLLNQLTTVTAPWVAVKVQPQQHIHHFVLLSNARTVEVHVGDAVICTYEGIVSTGGWFLHDAKCNASAGQTLKFKFFARKERSTIDVAVVCLVRDVVERTPSSENNHSNDAPQALESRLGQLEAQIHVSMNAIMRRLSNVEDRLAALEGRGSAPSPG
ncbi:uncharacterized protein TM35_000401030 [Trypanosoma theileri]|uniref:Uncharacterized protein n=1 Tax=Trypanosoma theileri TaxID=67003 RepID=A0A1X0NJI3_9TRYP|nr:uncharacterized protein TM35_000401030 [Trypanosoma theileri]ORC84836.1 hypothetical protein TM35_000401030 [Trypanosoma theileri]